jgi:hypothetical protein
VKRICRREEKNKDGEGNKLKKFVKLLRDSFRSNEWKAKDIFKLAEKLSESDAGVTISPEWKRPRLSRRNPKVRSYLQQGGKKLS